RYLRSLASGHPTSHGNMHALFAMNPITSWASGCFVRPARFAAEPAWRRWAVFAVAAGVATVVFITAFGAAGGHGGLAGLWERAAGGATSVLTVAVLARLAVTSRPAARALPRPAAREVAGWRPPARRHPPRPRGRTGAGRATRSAT